MVVVLGGGGWLVVCVCVVYGKIITSVYVRDGEREREREKPRGVVFVLSAAAASGLLLNSRSGCCG